MTGKLYLIPVTLGGIDFMKVIPDKVLEITRHLRVFIVEDIRSARRYLKLIDKKFPVDSSLFFELDKHSPGSDLEHYLEPVIAGSDTGLMSEAGLPGIADPGSRVISLAHKKEIQVIPLAGPSSIIMALISSGLNGQNFTFHGYLPVEPGKRALRLRELEKNSREGYAQVFMETPYRSQKMLESLLATCHGNTELCIAADITLPGEFIKTRKVSDWKTEIPDLRNRLVVFVIQ